jgi:hypothetical protein
LSLRWRVLLYIGVLHLLFAGLAVYLFLDNRLWLFAIEAVFAISLTVGIAL